MGGSATGVPMVQGESKLDVTAASQPSKRMRRPSGAPPPLPRKIGLTGALWLVLVLVVVVAGCVWLRVDPAPLDRFDAVITDALASLRTSALTSVFRWLDTVGSRGGLAVLGVAVVIAAAWFGRWRHVVIALVCLALLQLAAGGLILLAQRPRPFSVTFLAPWEGYSAPDPAIAGVALLLVSVAYMLIAPGRPRMIAKLAIAAGLAVVAFSRIYLGIDHFTDALFAAILGVAIPVALFRAFAPNETFPVRYGARSKSAHLDVSGARGEAIRVAMLEQLGFTVLEMKPVGLEGSGGSTPLKMRVIDETGAEREIFSKLYARTHVRADRWYKLGRSILYGRLEDETPFGTVRRFVEYEDYTLRLLGEYGFSTPAALGIVEITPEREYLIAMEFFEDAVEIGDAEIDDQIIDDGLAMIRRMWDVGLAHRDIKPANLMVQRGRLRLIDVFFVQVRPSAWRQAVDLGNMMLVLALRSDAPTVYEHALRYFTDEDLSEAFAATRGVASPSQLRQYLKTDGRKLLDEFRGMVPARRPIVIQRWSMRRVGLILVTLFVLFAAISTGIALLFPSRGTAWSPSCGSGSTMQLMAQAVPTATRVPCVESVPFGWSVDTSTIVRDKAIFVVTTTESTGMVTVTFTADCPASPPESARVLPVEGGCATYEANVPAGTPTLPSFDPGGGLSFTDRQEIVDTVQRDIGQVLCGAGAPPCE
jgi:tRNA A-37 threonylcarbamoyl transferase component Bud32/membrane-associated phospholipid phosphatase